MDEITDKEAPPTENPEEANKEEDERILKLACERFKQYYHAHKEDFEACDEVQVFISGDQWPEKIKSERESSGRPCLTLDHLNQYVRHVVNSGLMQHKDIKVAAMSGDADDKVAEVLAGMVRQIVQISTARVAYETGLRHECQVGFGYWRARVIPVPGSKTPQNPDGLEEITIRKIKDPRMVLMDPFCEYPDGRDGHAQFVLSKLTKTEFTHQYGDIDGVQSWHNFDTSQIIPFIGEDAIVVAEYYYRDTDDAQTVRWAILTPDKVLAKGVHHGNVLPIIRTVGEEYEVRGKERRRGMINNSSMDAQRTYNYSASAFTEAVALAPLAPYIAEAGQIEQYVGEWKDAHRVPRAVLRYDAKPIAGGQMAPPPQRSQPAGIPAGWQGMMTNLISDTQMIMGLAQPSVLGTGGAPVQSGAGINAQQEPGEINTYHYHEHWHIAIEQTGRVIMAMIPYVYTREQVVNIIGSDGKPTTAYINPQQPSPVAQNEQAINKVTSVSYNPSIGRYDVAITTGPSSATKKAEANRMLTSVVNAAPEIMKVAADLVVESMDMAGAEVLAKRLKVMLPPGVAEDEDGRLAMLQKSMAENQELKEQIAEMEKIIMGDREKSAAKLQESQMDHQAEVQHLQLNNAAELFKQRIEDSSALQLATIKARVDLETNTQNNIVKVLIARMSAQNKIDVEVVKSFTAASQEPTHESRMSGYLGVMDSLMSSGGGSDPAGELVTHPVGSAPLNKPVAIPQSDQLT